MSVLCQVFESFNCQFVWEKKSLYFLLDSLVDIIDIISVLFENYVNIHSKKKELVK